MLQVGVSRSSGRATENRLETLYKRSYVILLLSLILLFYVTPAMLHVEVLGSLGLWYFSLDPVMLQIGIRLSSAQAKRNLAHAISFTIF